MPSGSTLAQRRGPFLVPARSLLLAAGLIAISLGVVNLFHERHLKEVDSVYVVVAAAIGAVWLASLVLAFRGVKIALVLTAAIAFLEFGLISSSHFVAGAGAMSIYVTREGLSMAPILMALMSTCLLTFMTAIVCWTHPAGRLKRIRTLPFLLSSLVGSILVILYATDSVRRDDFGTANPEDGTFAATVSATFWLFGGLWIGRVRKTGALLIGLGTFMATFSFTALHLIKGGRTLGDIAAKTGWGWAILAGAMAVLACLSLLLAVSILLATILRRRGTAAAVTSPGSLRRSGRA
jgi:hypothetical protein